MTSNDRKESGSRKAQTFTFVYDITPVSKERPRFRVIGAGKKAFAQAYTPAKTKQYEAAIAQMTLDNILGFDGLSLPKLGGPLPISQAIGMEIVFTLPRPKSRVGERWHTGKEDLDNLIKSLLDGMQGVLFNDDRSVVAISAKKEYAGKDRPVGIICQVTLLDDQDEDIPVPKKKRTPKRKDNVSPVFDLKSCSCGYDGWGNCGCPR